MNWIANLNRTHNQVTGRKNPEKNVTDQRNPVHVEPDLKTIRTKRISPVALGWLCGHWPELKDAGWTSPELWRRDKSRGLAWLLIWDRPGLDISLSNNGGIVFQYINETGGAITQTAFPRGNYYGLRH